MLREKPVKGRARTPTVLQMEAAECGAACLAMVLAYYGRWEAPEALRVACGVSRDGSNACNMLKAARRYGLHAKGFRKDPRGLLKLPIPSIIHWNFNHYVVFEGIRGQHAYINDPGSGPRKIPVQELDEAFTGVVLAFEPGEQFRRGGARPSLLPELWQRLRFSRGGLTFVAMTSLLLVIPGVVIPVFAKVFVDDVLIARMQSWIGPLLIGMGITLLLRGLLNWLQLHYLLRLETKLSTTMASRYFHQLLSLPSSFFIQRHPGDLVSRVSSSDRVAHLLSGELATSVFNLVSVLFYAAVMAAYDLLLSIVGLALTALNVLALRLVARKRDHLNRNLLNEQGKMLSATVGSIASIETLKAGGMESDAFARWAGYQATTLSAQQSLAVVSSLLSVIPSIVAALTTTAILVLGGIHVMQGALTIGGLVAVQTLMASIQHPIGALMALGGNLQLAKGDFARLADVFRYPKPVRGDAEEQSPRQSGSELELREVSFGYNPLDPPLIENFSLRLRSGARIALVGGSGSGKTTIGRIACGLVEPTSGQVLLDGVPLQDVPPSVFSATVSYVDQEVMMFNGSVRENLTLWDATVPDSTLTRALKDADIHGEVAGRPGHYDSGVNEAGANFSGGQRQRLEIARALINAPAILVLDEATAALDPVTEKSIDDNLRRRGCSCIIIAHRLSTIRDCDEIIVLSHGQVAERGTHEQLLALGGEYKALIEATA